MEPGARRGTETISDREEFEYYYSKLTEHRDRRRELLSLLERYEKEIKGFKALLKSCKKAKQEIADTLDKEKEVGRNLVKNYYAFRKTISDRKPSQTSTPQQKKKKKCGCGVLQKCKKKRCLLGKSFLSLEAKER